MDVLGVFEEEFLESLEGDLGDGDGACLEEPRVDLFDQGLRRRPARDYYLLSLAGFDGLIYQYPRQLFQTLIPH